MEKELHTLPTYGWGDRSGSSRERKGDSRLFQKSHWLHDAKSFHTKLVIPWLQPTRSLRSGVAFLPGRDKKHYIFHAFRQSTRTGWLHRCLLQSVLGNHYGWCYGGHEQPIHFECPGLRMAKLGLHHPSKKRMQQELLILDPSASSTALQRSSPRC